jgi:hypothetical protein
MKIEILYVAECPSRSEAVKLVRDVLAAQGMAAEIHQVLVRDQEMANELEFPGSPTIRINGLDVADETGVPRHFALSCRLYGGSRNAGLPPAEMVRRAIAGTREGGER